MVGLVLVLGRLATWWPVLPGGVPCYLVATWWPVSPGGYLVAGAGCWLAAGRCPGATAGATAGVPWWPVLARARFDIRTFCQPILRDPYPLPADRKSFFRSTMRVCGRFPLGSPDWGAATAENAAIVWSVAGRIRHSGQSSGGLRIRDATPV